MVLTAFGQVSRLRAFVTVAEVFQKGDSVSSDNVSLWPYLPKSRLCSMYISLENLVTCIVPDCEFFGQPGKDMRCSKKTSDIDHNMICLLKYFNCNHPCNFPILWYFLKVPESKSNANSWAAKLRYRPAEA